RGGSRWTSTGPSRPPSTRSASSTPARCSTSPDLRRESGPSGRLRVSYSPSTIGYRNGMVRYRDEGTLVHVDGLGVDSRTGVDVRLDVLRIVPPAVPPVELEGPVLHLDRVERR